MRKNIIVRIIILLTISALVQVTGISQTSLSNDVVLSNEMKMNTVNKVSQMLNDNYIFQDKANEMGILIVSNFESGKYSDLNDPEKFAMQLTEDLQSVSKDKHIRVRFSPDQIIMMRQSEGKDENSVQTYLEELKFENYGFKKVERISGNIGYIDFRQFGSGDQIKEKVATVMAFVENCDALIFDMRNNGGGDPTGIQVITSYLFGEEPVHLNDLYYRPKDTTEEFWTLKNIEGKRMPEVPVYVLTSSYTFSGAEEFSYNLQNLKRATIVGETTGGGAHPGGMNIIDDNFAIFIPTGRAINPITKTNWEGIGVKPDVEVNSINALTKAHILALEKISTDLTDEKMKKTYNWMVESLTATLNDVEIDAALLKKYEGEYGDRKIYLEDGRLYYQRSGRQKLELTPMSENTFMLSEIDYFRLRFESDGNGNIISITGLYDNGNTDSSPRNN
ncbi:MAG: S41 family peptidase [Ignavibacteria bacterium]